ncbi:long-chain fatty-acid--CoA ligase FadD15 [Gordonia araii NBRC 100433]|uniref:Acyl-CoA synthetase n=1 Tax=Gordonia araii NBRC 100433 TaxID=1073574 RepID=G7H7M0_9ACTN|nr:long-chain fatty acid--CoA ligase [Gordonia araii]NNG97869.1 long-chain fatty acid--CoA ligase [Gordonia araii NBRC 100433]GAB11845.1 long-chain fatty-acid--CoA ligase FadD15 [Gordonia araii NBRC 100433]
MPSEYSVPAPFTIADSANCTDIVFDLAARAPDQPVILDKLDGQWQPVTAREVAERVTAIAKGFIAQGIKPGDRVALLSATRTEWILLDFAIWAAGAVTVPIYETSSGPQIDWICSDSEPVGIIAETPAHAATIDGTDAAGRLAHRWLIAPGDGAPGVIDELVAAGAKISDDEVTARRQALRADDPAVLIYTSGTTGRPKGCMLTHSNLLSEVEAVLSGGLKQFLRPGRRLLMFLPMAHVFAHAITLIAIRGGVAVGFFNDIPNLVPEFAVFRPSLILSVPRVFEKVYNTARQNAHDDGKGKIFDAAASTAIDYNAAKEQGSVGLALRLRHTVFDKLVYSKLRAALGGDCELAISGGAPLGARLGHFFSGVGIPVYEGYGLTETTAAFAVNTPGAVKVGTVGRPLAGNAVRIADDGEILLSGGVVFTGYWKNPEATDEAITDGWFHTGDIGKVDRDGFLSITGRKKEILVTAGGKNVSPAGLEDAIRSHPLVSQALVVGDKQPFIGALVTLDADAVDGWKSRNSIAADVPLADLVDNADLRAEIQSAIDQANTTVSHAEAIKKFRILPVDFTEETGEMTPTLKVKRNVVTEKFADDIAAIYAG